MGTSAENPLGVRCITLGLEVKSTDIFTFHVSLTTHYSTLHYEFTFEQNVRSNVRRILQIG